MEVADRDAQASAGSTILARILLNLRGTGQPQHRIGVVAVFRRHHTHEPLGGLLPHGAVGPHDVLLVLHESPLAKRIVQIALPVLDGDGEVDVGLALRRVLQTGAASDSALNIGIDIGLTVAVHGIDEVGGRVELPALLLTVLRCSRLLRRRSGLTLLLGIDSLLGITLHLLLRVAIGGLTLRRTVLGLCRRVLTLCLRIPILRSLLHTTVVVLIRHNFLLSSARRRTKSQNVMFFLKVGTWLLM